MKIDKYCLFNIKQLTKGNNMNNLKKVGLTALGTALVASSAQAAASLYQVLLQSTLMEKITVTKVMVGQ